MQQLGAHFSSTLTVWKVAIGNQPVDNLWLSMQRDTVP